MRASLGRAFENLRVPVIGAPMYIASGRELVIAQLRAGIIGAFPSLNARPAEQLDEWLREVRAVHESECTPPFAVNLIVHKSNSRLEHDLDVVVRHEVPIVITSAGGPRRVVEAVHGYGGVVLHDVTTPAFGAKALDAGVDGLILVCCGAGGHGGALSPFAFVGEVRRSFDGLIVLAGAISTGCDVAAARLLGADLVYMGTRFLATPEAAIADGYRELLLESKATDVIYTASISGIPGNYLRESLRRHGRLPESGGSAEPVADLDLGVREHGGPAPWRDLWSAGQGAGMIDSVQPVAELVAELAHDYERAVRRLNGATTRTPG
jgi:nitronate monooxygenase